jgi:hypothetical protein
MANRKDDPKTANSYNQDNFTSIEATCQNIIYVKRPVTINRSRNGAVIRIDAESTDILEDFATKTQLSVSKLASNFIKFAAEHTIIKEAEE